MLLQEKLIARVREVCLADGRLEAAAMRDSLLGEETDLGGGIEFWLFFDERRHADLDQRAWCSQLADVLHLVREESGAHVALFPGLVRGTFHFLKKDTLAEMIGSWPARGAPVDRMIVVDRNGELRRALEALPDLVPPPTDPEAIETLCGQFANWLVLAYHVARQGEQLRAWDALSHVNRYLLWMARLDAGATGHWLIPSLRAEQELPPSVIDDLRDSTNAGTVRDAIADAWRCGRHHWTALALRHGRPVPQRLFEEIDNAITAVPPGPVHP